MVGLGDRVSPTDIEEGMRVGVDRTKYQIQIPLPPKIDPTVTMMTVEEKPDITYSDIGGSKEQIEKVRVRSHSNCLAAHDHSLRQLGRCAASTARSDSSPASISGSSARTAPPSTAETRRELAVLSPSLSLSLLSLTRAAF